MKKTRQQQAQDLLEECNIIFSESIQREYTFHEANITEHWGKEPPESEFFEEPWTCWKDIPDEVLNENCYIFSFFDFDESLFYLAAFIRLSLKDEALPNRDLQYSFTESTLSFVGKNFDSLSSYKLTKEQCEFIHKYVKFFFKSEEDKPWLDIHRETPIKSVLYRAKR